MNNQQSIIEEARQLLSKAFKEHEDQGILAVYLWGSITRHDFDAKISDVDAIMIVNQGVDLGLRPIINQWLKANFSHHNKFGVQFYGIEELNGDKAYTLLGELQPAGYLLLRFNDWIHVAGKRYKRSNFAAKDFTPLEARNHQRHQVSQALAAMAGNIPMDPRRSSIDSMAHDVVKGALGTIYWQSVIEGNHQPLDYNHLVGHVTYSLKPLTTKLLELRHTQNYQTATIMSLKPELEQLLKL